MHLFYLIAVPLLAHAVEEHCADENSALLQKGLSRGGGGLALAKKTEYFTVAAGSTCSSETLITSSEECETAAQATGWNYLSETHQSKAPYGCYWNGKKGKAQLNLNSSSLETAKKCGGICAMASSTTTTSTTTTSTTTTSTTRAVDPMDISCSVLQDMCTYSIGSWGVQYGGCPNFVNKFATGCYDKYGYADGYQNCTSVIAGQLSLCYASTSTPYYQSDCESSVCDDIYVIEKPSGYCSDMQSVCDSGLKWGTITNWIACTDFLYYFQDACMENDDLGSEVCGSSGDDNGNLMSNQSSSCYTANARAPFTYSSCLEAAGC